MERLCRRMQTASLTNSKHPGAWCLLGQMHAILVLEQLIGMNNQAFVYHAMELNRHVAISSAVCRNGERSIDNSEQIQ